MLRTRVGYAGGEKTKPTYHAMGDHTESISIDFDPSVISYEDLLKHFWEGHRCVSAGRSRQYMHAVFYRDEKQKVAAEKSRDAQAEALGVPVEKVSTQILPEREFTYAEGYHQKFSLGRSSEIRLFLEEVYPDAKSLADSAVATRLNAYVGSGMEKDWAKFLEELPSYGLPEKLERQMREKGERF